MPDIPNRDELERRLAGRLSGLLQRQMGELLELLGDPPDLGSVPASFWTTAGDEFTAVVLPFLENVYLEAAQRMLANSVIGVDWALVNNAAIQWARQYGFDLVSGITQTSRTSLQDMISRFFSDQETIGQLTDRLAQLFGPLRADMIAQTEVTRASVQGEFSFVRELEQQGVRMQARWQTNEDERVCPICNPLNDTLPEVWRQSAPDGPPAHVRCRCWLNHEFMEQ